jgi:hypothetical protein
VWRAVEAQHQISTRRLVDSDEEQRLLEDLIESSKPPYRSTRRMHYLLATAFRYPPLRHGSRFGTRHQTSLWYGALTLRTVFAEVAYYRLLFIEGTAADLGIVETQLSAFSIPIKTDSGIDLTRDPFDRYLDDLMSPVSYRETQLLGTAMREHGVEAFLYRSARDTVDDTTRDTVGDAARDPARGINIGVFSEKAFASTRPRHLETWHCVADRSGVEVTRRDYFKRASHAFPRENFLLNGVLPVPR